MSKITTEYNFFNPTQSISSIIGRISVHGHYIGGKSGFRLRKPAHPFEQLKAKEYIIIRSVYIRPDIRPIGFQKPDIRHLAGYKMLVFFGFCQKPGNRPPPAWPNILSKCYQSICLTFPLGWISSSSPSTSLVPRQFLSTQNQFDTVYRGYGFLAQLESKSNILTLQPYCGFLPFTQNIFRLNPYLKILELSKLFVADAPMKKKVLPLLRALLSKG